MKENITVEQALSKGRWQLKHLPMIVTFSIIFVSIYLTYAKIVEGWIILPIGFLSGFISGWLVWSYFAANWKIWAYENVRNVHELQRKAVEEKLIWEKGNWLEKTEFKNDLQKQKLKQLDKKFLEKDIFKDDISVPNETLIYYSKTSIIFSLIIYVIIGLTGIFLVFIKQYFGLLFIGLSLYLIYGEIKKLSDNKPQIIINAQGIQLKDDELVSWKDIYNDSVFLDRNQKNAKQYLAFNDEKIEINDLDIALEDLENLLHVYRVRFEKSL
ncbi:hypothetical protein HNP37_004389 [Flavobacterium nitrogenifigens]|uniref:Uncharacterized protein n=2 Tax=Flavobacterium TaxID=237 RepID=A0A7W7NAA7_9FLAO|nr:MULTISPECIES: hypothetical protein [Flavobacterium]MBB4804302.1 hypothetical protein [Flavobacterium nitrogenifigens]MBB6389302.1 hypothetical protein [Flavobacterium notoginsengisoli]